jgi:rod shape-determining protein MreC
VAFRESPFKDIKVPLTWTAAGAVVLCLVIAIALLITDRRETLQADAYGAMKRTADAIQRPISGAVAAPVRWVEDAVDYVGGYFFAVSENRRLKAENRRLHQVNDQVIALNDLNERYRALLGLKTDPPVDMVTGRSVTDARGPFANARLINVGKEAGVLVGNPVMSENGLVGRVTGVTLGASRVLLLTDIASRTPVMIDRTNARAILTGDGGPNPKLAFLRTIEAPKPGDRVLTSGDGGVMPRGLPVGVAVKGVDGSWRVALSADQTRIDFVRILKFKDFSQTVNVDELSAPVLPGQMGGPPPPTPTESAPPGTGPQIAAPPAKAAGKAGPKPTGLKKLAAKLGLTKSAPPPAATPPAASTGTPAPAKTPPPASKVPAAAPIASPKSAP